MARRRKMCRIGVKVALLIDEDIDGLLVSHPDLEIFGDPMDARIVELRHHDRIADEVSEKDPRADPEEKGDQGHDQGDRARDERHGDKREQQNGEKKR